MINTVGNRAASLPRGDHVFCISPRRIGIWKAGEEGAATVLVVVVDFSDSFPGILTEGLNLVLERKRKRGWRGSAGVTIGGLVACLCRVPGEDRVKGQTLLSFVVTRAGLKVKWLLAACVDGELVYGRENAWIAKSG